MRQIFQRQNLTIRGRATITIFVYTNPFVQFQVQEQNSRVWNQ